MRVNLEKKSYVLVGFLFAFDVVLSLWGFDPLVKLSVSSAMYIIVDSYMFRTGEVVCIYVSKYLVVEMECIAFKVSLADVMHKKRSFRVWPRVTYPRRWTISHLHWVVHHDHSIQDSRPGVLFMYSDNFPS